MSLAAALIYWMIVAMWLAVLVAVTVAYARNPRTFGTIRLLLIVVGIDTCRNIVENFYFGVYFGAQYGLFPDSIIGVLGRPSLLILPKLMNVAAAIVVLSVLLLRWLPMAAREHLEAEEDARSKSSALDREVEEHRRLYDTSVDLIVVTDADRVITRISASCTAILGYQPGEMIGHYGGEFVATSDLATLRSELTMSSQGEAIRHFQCDFLHKSGACVTLALSGVWSEQAQRFFLIGRDMTDQNAADERLRYLAHFDQLTGLPNRTRLLEDVRQFVTAGSAPTFSLAMVDLDDFKDVNDTLGHATGDRLLKLVALRLVATLSPDNRVYRLGGDEFLVLFPDCRDPLVATEAVNAIVVALEDGFEIDGQRIHLSVSVGVATATAETADADELIANADLALYDAKSAGGHKYRLFVPSMRATAQARVDMEVELKRACQHKEFVLFFQPQLRLSDGKVTGAEALLRWQHPTRGLLEPAAFIEALATSPLALEVGNWILREACMAAADWRRGPLPHARIGVNLFPSQLHGDDLVGAVKEALRHARLPPEALEIEITENIALSNSDTTTWRRLRRLGVGLAFDDFGTGYASLSCLMHYPLTRLKIDRSFIQNITSESGPRETAIVGSILEMAHNLGIGVIAEGVETLDQAAFLRANHCDEVQGFLYACPLSAGQLALFLRQTEETGCVPANLRNSA